MLNTCSIGRRWKSREGWSRPVLTGERGTLFPTLAGRVSSCGGFLVGWQGMLFLVVTMMIGKAFIARVRCPVPGPPRPESWSVPLPAAGFSGRPYRIGFAVVMAQVRRPVPFRTRKLRPGTAMVLHSRGCGRVARRRIHMLGVPVELRLRDPPFFYALFCRPAGRSTLPRGCPSGLSRCSASGLFHAPGDLERRGISGISGEPLALIRWLNRLKNYALFRTQTLCRIEQNHVSRQSNSPAGRRPKLA